VRFSADRLTAARLLMRVESGAFSSRLLSRSGDAGVRARVFGVLRWMRTLDVVIEPLCRRPLVSLDPEVRAALRLGLFEAMHMDRPPALATDGAVRLVRRLGRSSASGMVNAVLRRATAGWRETLAGAEIDVRLSHPNWLYERWRQNFGADAAEQSLIAAQDPAKTWVWFRGDVPRNSLREDGVTLFAHPWCPGAWTVLSNPGRLIEEVVAGNAYAQDPSSQLVAHVARALAPDADSCLDLCAAPGGKTALLTHLRKWPVAVAMDIQLTRTRLMLPLLAGLDGSLVVTADATMAPFQPRSWDLVLLDAPCTGTGTFRRHPELKWRLRPKNIEEMSSRQRLLLDSGLGMLAPGGTLLYSTCSVEPEENEGVVAGLPGGFLGVEIAELLPEKVPFRSTAGKGVRIMPGLDGDGFTMHAVRRRFD
jgi:16S rRNA (cytosine967-C5)-methyltransferase